MEQFYQMIEMDLFSINQTRARATLSLQSNSLNSLFPSCSNVKQISNQFPREKNYNIFIDLKRHYAILGGQC